MDFPERVVLMNNRNDECFDVEVLSDDSSGRERILVYDYKNSLNKQSIILSDSRLQEVCSVSESSYLRRQSKEAQFKHKIERMGLLSVINAEILGTEVPLNLDLAESQQQLIGGDGFREQLVALAKRYQTLREHDVVTRTLMHEPVGGAKQSSFDHDRDGNYTGMSLYDSPCEIVTRFRPKREVITARIDLLCRQEGRHVISEVKNFLSAATTRKAIDQIQLYHDAYVLFNGTSVGRDLLTRNVSLMGFGFLYDSGISVTTVETPYTLAVSTRKNIRDLVMSLNDFGFDKSEIPEMIMQSGEFQAIGGENIFKVFENRGMNFYKKCRLEKLLAVEPDSKYPPEPEFMREALLASAEQQKTSFFYQDLRFGSLFYRPEFFDKNLSVELEEFCAGYDGKVPMWQAFPTYLAEQEVPAE
jgi:hypothetical protein